MRDRAPVGPYKRTMPRVLHGYIDTPFIRNRDSEIGWVFLQNLRNFLKNGWVVLNEFGNFSRNGGGGSESKKLSQKRVAFPNLRNSGANGWWHLVIGDMYFLRATELTLTQIRTHFRCSRCSRLRA